MKTPPKDGGASPKDWKDSIQSSSAASLEVQAIRPATKPRTIKAFANVRYGGLIIRDCKIIQQPGQSAWVAPPDVPWTGADGKVRYKRLVEFAGKEIAQAFSNAVLMAWRAQP